MWAGSTARQGRTREVRPHQAAPPAAQTAAPPRCASAAGGRGTPCSAPRRTGAGRRAPRLAARRGPASGPGTPDPVYKCKVHSASCKIFKSPVSREGSEGELGHDWAHTFLDWICCAEISLSLSLSPSLSHTHTRTHTYTHSLECPAGDDADDDECDQTNAAPDYAVHHAGDGSVCGKHGDVLRSQAF